MNECIKESLEKTGLKCSELKNGLIYLKEANDNILNTFGNYHEVFIFLLGYRTALKLY